MRRIIRFACLLALALALVACGSAPRAGQQTPIVAIQTAPPLATATAQPTEVPTEAATPTQVPQVQITRALNLRAGPSTEFSIIRTLPVDAMVELVSRRDENGERWYEVRVDNAQGWASGEIVQVDTAQAAALPPNDDSFIPPTSTPKPTAVPRPTAKPTAAPAAQQVAPSFSSVHVAAICRDGTHSNATGRGACSHHGAVDHWLYT